MGQKQTGDPSGLIAASQAAGGDGIIFVAPNYRLGAMGWLGGPTLVKEGGVPNAGLYDQRLAIEWVAKYIHLFGGNPNMITLIGESAGGGSIIHQITAYGGSRDVSFQQAIPQSPGWLQITNQSVPENITQTFLGLLNATSIHQARNMTSAQIIAANQKQVTNARYGFFGFGPVVDGNFVPAQPGRLLAQGKFAKKLNIMPGHNTNEGVSFTSPLVNTSATLAQFLELSYPDFNASTANYVVNTLYPAVFNGSYPYTNGYLRSILLTTESAFTCNTRYLDLAFGNQSFAYQFEVPPALHGQDVAYTFYNGGGSNRATGLVAPIAQAMQAYITNFAIHGNPNGPGGLPYFPKYQSNSTEMGLNITGLMPQMDPDANMRCAWWQHAPF